MQESKACKTCNQIKTLDEVHKRLERRVAHCKECTKVKTRQRYVANAESLREKARQYRQANPDKVKKLRQDWKRANKAKNVESVVAYQRRNPDKHAKWAKTYRQNNLAKYRLWAQNRLAKLSQNGVYYVSPKEVEKLLSSDCVACGSSSNQTLDHIIPIDLGGTHSIGNLQTLCLSCNSSKRNRVMTVWKKSLGLFAGTVKKL